MTYVMITSEMLTWNKLTLARVYTLSKMYNAEQINQSFYICERSSLFNGEEKRLISNNLKLSYRTYAKYINELPQKIVYNGNDDFFVPVDSDVLMQMVSQRLSMGYSYSQVNNWVRVLLYFIYNCGRFHLFSKGMNQMVAELGMNRAEAINNIEDLLTRDVIKRAFNGYKNKSGFGVASSYVLNDTSLFAAEFYSIWKK